MPNPRTNADNGIPNDGYGGNPNSLTPLFTDGTPTFIVSPTTPPSGDQTDGGIPLANQYLEDGSMPVFWIDNQIQNSTTQRYHIQNSNEGLPQVDNSTLSIPMVVRFLYAYNKKVPDALCSGGVSPPPPPVCSGEIILYQMFTSESSITGDVTLISTIPAAGTKVYFSNGPASDVNIEAIAWREDPPGSGNVVFQPFYSGVVCGYAAASAAFVAANPPSWSVPAISGLAACCAMMDQGEAP